MSKKISYILATRNKLPYLKGTLEHLLAAKTADAEILVADGASTDGSKEYLMELKAAGKIDYLVSERDTGLAHALNKLVLASRGEFIKYITDDDAFDYGVIQKCLDFMEAHPKIDLGNTEGGSLNNPVLAVTEKDPLQMVRAITYQNHYRQWQKDHSAFSFCDLGMLYRKSSLPLIGFWAPFFPGPDVELSLRVSKGKVNIAWYTGFGWVNISNPQSVSIVYMKKTKDLTERIMNLYFGKKPDFFVFQKWKVLKNKLRARKRTPRNISAPPFTDHWPDLVGKSQEWMQIKNNQQTHEFIWNN